MIFSLIIVTYQRFKHYSTAEPEAIGKGFSLDNAVHFVDTIIVLFEDFFLFVRKSGR